MAVIARGEINVSLNDAAARRELRSLEQNVKNTMRSIDRSGAEAKVTLDHDDYDRAYKKVKAQIQDLKKERATAVVRMDVDGVTKAQAEIRLLEAQLRQFAIRRYETQVRVDVDRNSKRAVDALTETIRKLTAGKWYTNIGVDVDESDLRRVEAEVLGSIKSLERRKAKLIIEGDATGVAGVIAEIKTLDAVLKETQGRIRDFERERQLTRIEIKPELNDRELRMMRAQLRSEIASLEREHIQLRIDGDVEGVQRIQERINTLVASMEDIQRRRFQIRNPFRGWREDADRSRNSFQRLGGTVERISHLIREGRGWWNDFGGSILGAGIRLGPLTLRLRAAVAVMTYLAPLIISLVGAFGALASVIYTGLLGTLGPAVAGLGALGVGLGGIALVMTPLIQDFGKAQKASEAYDKAVRENGRNSDQAADKLEKLRRVMGNISPEAARSFRQIDKLGGTWRRLTAAARPVFFETVADAVRTVRQLMPQFAQESVRTFQVASDAFRGWLRGLRGTEARGIFRSLFRGAQESIPNLIGALGNLGTFLGRVARAAMPLWEEFTRTLERWTGGWADAAKDTGGVRDFLRGLADDTRALGRFLGAAARALHNLFMGGRGAGRSFLDTMTATLNRWADFLATAEGQNKVAEFFRESVDMAQTFFSIVGNLTKIFFNVAEAMAPVARILSQIINLITGLPGISTSLVTVLGLVLAARMLTQIYSRIVQIGAAIAAFKAGGGLAGALAAGGTARGQLLGRLPAATTVAGEVGAGAAAGRAASGAGRGGRVAAQGIEAAGGAAAGAATRASALSRALTGLRVGFSALTGPVGLTVAGVAAVAASLTTLTNQGGSTIDRVNRLKDTFNQSQQAMKIAGDAQRNLSQAGFQYRGANLEVQRAERDVNRLRRQGKTGTDEYRYAVLQLEQAYNNQRTAETTLNRTIRAGTEAAHSRVASWRQIKQEAIAQGKSTQELERIERNLQQAINAEIAVNINAARSRKGLAAVTGEAGIKMGFLVKQFQKLPRGDAIRKFFIQADTRQAEAGIRNIQRLQRAGVSDRQIIRIFASTDDAELALAKVRALAQNIDKLRPNVDVGAKDNASGRIRGVRGLAQGLVRAFVLTIAGKGDGPTKNKIGTVRALAQSIVRTFMATLQARDPGRSVVMGFLGLLAGIPRVITTILSTRRTGGGGRGGGGRGAVGGERPETAVKTSGRVVSRNTFLTGEERTPEIVISTNPSYRRRNRGLLRYAARALGMPQVGQEIQDVLSNYSMPVGPFTAEDEIPAFKEGGVTKKDRARFKKRKRVQQRRTRKKSAQIRGLNRRWQPEVRNEQQRVEKIENNIRDRVQKRDQDDTQFSIDLDNNPIVTQDEEGNDILNETARQERVSKIQNLMAQTQAIITRYNDLKNALNRAVEKINDVIERFKRRRESISTKRYGSKGAKALRKQIDEKVADLTGDRKSAYERLHEIGDEKDRGEQRGERLQYNQYDAEVRQTRAITARSQDTAAGGTSGADDSNNQAIADQANARATAFQRLAEISEGALRAFGGASDLGIGIGARARASALASDSSERMGSLATAAASAATAAVGAANQPAAQTPTPAVAAGGGGPQIVINTLHPGDPATLDAIGRAATGGMALQGYVPSPREATGL